MMKFTWNKLRDVRNFFRIALKDFGHIGSFFPSTKYASKSVARHVPQSPDIVVEYGAGNGIITRELLKRIPAGGRLISVEQNEAFLPALTSIGDSRLEVIHGDVVEVAGKLPTMAPAGVDAVVSGIPFSLMKEQMGKEVVDRTRRALKANGRFIVYQNSLKVADLLEHYFPRVKWFFEPRNVMPYFIFVASPEKKQNH